MAEKDPEDLGEELDLKAEAVDDEAEPKESIEKPKAKRYKKPKEGDGRKKKERTEAQKAAWAKCVEARAKNRSMRKAEDDEKKAQVKEATKEKIVKKAVRVKKKYQRGRFG